MDEICKALAEKIGESPLGVYSIFYDEELLDALPDDVRNRETLEAALKKLSGEGCVDVRYARGSAFCIAYLRPYVIDQPVREVTATPPPIPAVAVDTGTKSRAVAFFISFAGGLFGGFLGALIAVLGVA